MSRALCWFPLICSLNLLLFQPMSVLHAESDTETLTKIRRAWAERRNAIKTFHFVCALDERTKVVRGETHLFGDSEDPSHPPLYETFRKTLMFSLDNGKLAYRLEGEHWSEITQAKEPYLFQVAFNGLGNKSLLRQASAPHGRIDHRREPDGQFTGGTHLVPFRLTFDTERELYSARG